MSLDLCSIHELPQVRDSRGALTFLEWNRQVPFEVKRIFYVYDVPEGQNRGAHAHHELHQMLICLAGGLTVHLDDGSSKRSVTLDKPWQGLHIPPRIWAAEDGFMANTVYMVLASDTYSPESYIHDYQAFLKMVNAHA